MGITGFMTWLRKYCPEAIGTVPLSNFKGHSIDIDAHYWAYENMSIIRKKMIAIDPLDNLEPDESKISEAFNKAALDFVKCMLEHGVTPTFVFDGDEKYDPSIGHVNMSAAKKDTMMARREERKVKKDKMVVLKNVLMAMDPLSIDSGLKTEYRKLLGDLVEFGGTKIQTLKEVLMAVGVTCLQARYDGEQLCSMRAREGKCAAVFSNDTDNIVYGCPVLFTEYVKSSERDSQGRYIKTCSVINNRILTQKLENDGVNTAMFIDFCITSKCDYNEKIPGIGPMTAFKLVKEHKCIEKFPSQYDTKVLNYELCRKIFTPVTSSSMLISPKSTHLPHGASDSKNSLVFVPGAVADGAFGFLMKYSLTDYVTWYNKIYERWEMISTPKGTAVSSGPKITINIKKNEKVEGELNNDKKNDLIISNIGINIPKVEVSNKKDEKSGILTSTQPNNNQTNIEKDKKLSMVSGSLSESRKVPDPGGDETSKLIDLITGIPRVTNNKIVIKIVS
ncbi:MAG: Flap endonuclease 1 [Solumvirus sp.]|uniref:Flap endonuclease 1 n=1 Tax=Solumvirus sp. TaxID=2487773 RepID=A0A3G5AG67_9VIRU|nr:MAG: Flap endonuclease 1 [Solumvirus sp.]